MLTVNENARDIIHEGFQTAPARHRLLRRLVQLRRRQDQIKITWYDDRHGPEFGLTWITEEGKPYMHGGLVYHGYSNDWGIHT